MHKKSMVATALLGASAGVSARPAGGRYYASSSRAYAYTPAYSSAYAYSSVPAYSSEYAYSSAPAYTPVYSSAPVYYTPEYSSAYAYSSAPAYTPEYSSAAAYYTPVYSSAPSYYTPEYSSAYAYSSAPAYTPAYKKYTKRGYRSTPAYSSAPAYTPAYSSANAYSSEAAYTPVYSSAPAYSSEAVYTPAYSSEAAYTPAYSSAAAYSTPAYSSEAAYSTPAYSSAPSYSSAPVYGADTGSPFKFPLANGFPDDKNVEAIQKQAQGTLSNGDPPPKPQPDSLASLGFVAFNELFEVAFFTELIQNITSNVPGYGYKDIRERDEVLRTLRAVVAQEELHELNANGAFNAFTGKTIEPCAYDFPVDNFNDAIALASLFTDMVLGTLPDLQTIFADNGDNGLIRGVGSVIGQEGEQNGFYRHILGKLPPALPFLTGGARDFAFNAIIQNFVVPNSCPSLDLLVDQGLTEFGVLKVLTPEFSLDDIVAEFSIDLVLPAEGTSLDHYASGDMYLTYINQQNKPFSVSIKNQHIDHETGTITFKASFPGKSNDLNGLTIAAITTSDGPFGTPADVAAATLIGPGLIEV